MTSPNRTGADLQGWIDAPWAIRGQSRSVFFQNVLVRICPDFINPLLARAADDLVTIGYDFWSGAGTDAIYRTFAMIHGFDWGLVGFIASQDSVFIRRLNKHSKHDFQRAKQFLEQFTEYNCYRNMALGPQSDRFDVSAVCCII